MINDENKKNNGTAPETEEVNTEPQTTETVKKDKTDSKKISFTKKRSFKYGSMATAFTAIFIAIVLLLNVGITIVGQKFPLNVDLTKTNDFGITDESIKYVKNTVKSPITIKIFSTKGAYDSISYLTQVGKILEQFSKHNNNISISYIDYDKNPTAAAAYADENIAQYDIVVSNTVNGKERYKHIPYMDFFLTQTDSSTSQQTIVGNKAEQEIDSAIDYVTNEKMPTVAFTTGHDEADSTDLQGLYKQGNFNIKTVNTASEDLSADFDTVVIVAPSADFSEDEISKLDKFLNNGGKYGKNCFIFLDPRQKEVKNLEEFMSEWGIKAENGVIYDSTNNFNDSAFDVMSDTINSDYAGKIASDIKTDVRVARPLTALYETKSAKTTATVITTNSNSQLLEDLSKKTASSDPKGAYATMIASTMAGESAKSTMVVSGSYEMTLSNQINASNKSNSKVLLGVANTLMAKTPTIQVMSKDTDTSTLSLTTAQRIAIIVIFLILIPIAILIFGLVKWLRRRHL